MTVIDSTVNVRSHPARLVGSRRGIHSAKIHSAKIHSAKFHSAKFHRVLLHWAMILVAVWIPLGAAAAAHAAPQSDVPLVARERPALDHEFQSALSKLADQAAANGLREQAEATTNWFIRRDPQRIYLFIPAANDPHQPDEGAPAAVRAWYDAFRELRTTHAAALFDLARRVLDDGDGASAYQLLHEVVHHDPDHAEARRILGYRHDAEGWTQGASAFESKRATRRHGFFPWRAGQYFLVHTQNFQITTTHSQEEGERLGRTLERLQFIWRQLYFDYWSDRDVLARRFDADGLTPLPRLTRKLKVVLFRDRDEYVQLLRDQVPGIEATEGYYEPGRQESFFFVSDPPREATWYHEATHQLFEQVVRTGDNVGGLNGAWSLEAIATFMESFQDKGSHIVLGGFDADRLQFARFRLISQDIYFPLQDLVQLGKTDLQTHASVRMMYSQSAGIAHFLMTGDGGRYRQAMVAYLKDIYGRGRHRPDALVRLTGQSFGQLDEEYKAFLAVNADQFQAYLSQPEALRNLMVGFSDVNDDCLALLKESRRLELLDLSATQVTDAGLEYLENCQALSQLFLGGTAVSNEGMRALARLDGLQEIDLAGTRVSDEGVGYLQRLPRLYSLRLSGTPVSDEALRVIAEIKTLRSLDLEQTRISDAAVARLKRDRPDINVVGK